MTDERMVEIEALSIGARTQQLHIECFVDRIERSIFIQFGNRGSDFEGERTFKTRPDRQQAIGVFSDSFIQAPADYAAYSLSGYRVPIR